MKRRYFLLPILLMISLVSCGETDEADAVSVYGENVSPIIGGTPVPDGEYNEVVYTWATIGFCSGTLISSDYVLTAAHCVSETIGQNIKVIKPSDIYIYFGSDSGDRQHLSFAKDIIIHPEYSGSDLENGIRNDLALIRLDKSVPRSVAIPVPPLPPELRVTAEEIKNLDKEVTHVGFGRTEWDNPDIGFKYKADNVIAYVCSGEERSASCDNIPLMTDNYIGFSYDLRKVSLYYGDSGGPTFIVRHGKRYIAGVTSFGYMKHDYSLGYTVDVSQYYNSFIRPNAGDVILFDKCVNGRDDDGNGVKDCDDPQCADILYCQPEICNNARDDNANAQIDCDDPQCAEVPGCRELNCTNNLDDNGDGLTDCDDPLCSEVSVCRTKSDSACASAPLVPARMPWAVLTAMSAGLVLMRRKRRA